MKNPIALVVVLVLCLGAAAWFVLSEDEISIVDPVEPRTEIKTPAEDPSVLAQDATANRSPTSELSRATIEQKNAAETVDPLYAKAMSGFRGRLVLESGDPIEGKRIQFYRADPELLQNASLFAEAAVIQPKLIQYEGRSDANGAFLVEGAWPKVFYLMVIDARGDHQKAQLVEKTPGPGEIVDLGDIVLPTLGTISGTVKDLDGEAAVGALVRAADVPGAALDMAPLERFDPRGGVLVSEGGIKVLMEMPPWVQTVFDQLPLPTTTTDADGAFTLRGVQPGDNVVVVNHAGHVPLVRKGVRVKPGKEKKVGRLALKEGEIAEGQVLDSNDEPVVGAEVFLAPKSPTIPAHFGSFAKATNAEGKFSQSGFPPGPVFAAVRRSPDEAWTLEGPVSVGGDIKIKLPAKVAVRVKVRTETGATPEDVEFRMVALPANGPGVDFGSLGFTPFIDVSKRITKTPEGAYEIGDLIPGQYSLVARAKGYAAAKITFAAAAGTEAEVLLAPSLGFQVQARDRAGKPVQNVKIYLMNRSRGGRVQEMPVVAGLTDAEGRLDVVDGRKGKLRVTASHPAYGLYHAEVELPSTAPTVFTLLEPGVLTGELLTNGNPAELGKYTISVEPTWKSNRGAMPSVPRLATPDAEGRFRVAGLSPGQYRVTFFKSLDAVNSPSGIFQLAMASSEWRNDVPEPEISSGTETHVVVDTARKPEIKGPSIAVTGTVLVNGQVPKGLQITGWGNQTQIRSDIPATGRFDLGRVGVGWTHLNLTLKDSGIGGSVVLWSASMQTKEGEDQHIDINVETGTLSGMVVDVAGNPIAGVQVRASGKVKKSGDKAAKKKVVVRRQEHQLTARTDSRGRFRFDLAPVATYRFTATHDSGVGRASDVQVMAGLASPEVRIQLAKAYTIKGKVDLSMLKKKPENMYVWVQGDGFNRGFNVAVTDGSFEMTGLPAGKYKGQASSWGGGDSSSWTFLEPLEVTGDQENVVIRLKKR